LLPSKYFCIFAAPNRCMVWRNKNWIKRIDQQSSLRSRRAEETAAGGSVYLRSQPGGAGEETPGRGGARAGNGKQAVIRWVGIPRQVGRAAARG